MDPIIIALITWMPATIAAIAAAIVSISNSWKLDKNQTTTEQTKNAVQSNEQHRETTVEVVAKRVEAAVSDRDEKTAAAIGVVSKQLNGALEGKINEIVRAHTEPLVKAFKEHNECDERNMHEIRDALKAIEGK